MDTEIQNDPQEVVIENNQNSEVASPFSAEPPAKEIVKPQKKCLMESLEMFTESEVYFPSFICTTCDTSNICKDCFETCHFLCSKALGTIEEQSCFKQNYCHCALNHHSVKDSLPIDEQGEAYSCVYATEFKKLYLLEAYYYMEEEQKKYLCLHCALVCHKDFTKFPIEKESLENIDKLREAECCCNHTVLVTVDEEEKEVKHAPIKLTLETIIFTNHLDILSKINIDDFCCSYLSRFCYPYADHSYVKPLKIFMDAKDNSNYEDLINADNGTELNAMFDILKTLVKKLKLLNYDLSLSHEIYEKSFYDYFFDFKFTAKLLKLDLNINLKLFEILVDLLRGFMPNYYVIQEGTFEISSLLKLNHENFLKIVKFNDLDNFLEAGFFEVLTKAVKDTFESSKNSKVVYLRENYVSLYFKFVLIILNIRHLGEDQLLLIYNNFFEVFTLAASFNYNLDAGLEVLVELYISLCQNTIYIAVVNEDINYSQLKSNFTKIIIENILSIDSSIFFNKSIKSTVKPTRELKSNDQWISNIYDPSLKREMKNSGFKITLSNIIQQRKDYVIETLDFYLRNELEKDIINYFNYLNSSEELRDTTWLQIDYIRSYYYVDNFCNSANKVPYSFSTARPTPEQYMEELLKHVSTVEYFLLNSDKNFVYRFVENHLMRFVYLFQYICNYTVPCSDEARINELKQNVQMKILDVFSHIANTSVVFAKLFIEAKEIFTRVIFPGNSVTDVTKQALKLIDAIIDKYKECPANNDIRLDLTLLLNYLNTVDQPLFSAWNSGMFKIYRSFGLYLNREYLIGYEEATVCFIKNIITKLKKQRVGTFKKPQVMSLNHILNIICAMPTKYFLQIKDFISPLDGSYQFLETIRNVKDYDIISTKANVLYTHLNLIFPFFLNMETIMSGSGFEAKLVDKTAMMDIVSSDDNQAEIFLTKHQSRLVNTEKPVNEVNEDMDDLDKYYDIFQINSLGEHRLIYFLYEFINDIENPDKHFMGIFQDLIENCYKITFAIIHFFVYQLIKSRCEDDKLFITQRISHLLLVYTFKSLERYQDEEKCCADILAFSLSVNLNSNDQNQCNDFVKKLKAKLEDDIMKLEKLDVSNASFKTIFDIMNYYFDIAGVTIDYKKKSANFKAKESANKEKKEDEEEIKKLLITTNLEKDKKNKLAVNSQSMLSTLSRKNKVSNKNQSISKVISNLNKLLSEYTADREETCNKILDSLLDEKNNNYKLYNKNIFNILIELSFEEVGINDVSNEPEYYIEEFDLKKLRKSCISKGAEKVNFLEKLKMNIDFYSLQNLLSLSVKNSNFGYLQDNIVLNSNLFAPKIFDLVQNHIPMLLQMFLVGFKSFKVDSTILPQLTQALEFLRLLSEGYNRYFQTFLTYALVNVPGLKPITFSNLIIKVYTQLFKIARQYSNKLRTFQMSKIFHKDIESIVKCVGILNDFLIEISQGCFSSNFVSLYSRENLYPLSKEVNYLTNYLITNPDDVNRQHILIILKDYYRLLTVLLEEYQILPCLSPLLDCINFKAACQLNYLCYYLMMTNDYKYTEQDYQKFELEGKDIHLDILSLKNKSRTYKLEAFQTGCFAFQVIKIYCWIEKNDMSWNYYLSIPSTQAQQFEFSEKCLDGCSKFFDLVNKGVELLVLRQIYFDNQAFSEYSSFLNKNRLDQNFEKITRETKNPEAAERRYIIYIYFQITETGHLYDEKLCANYIKEASSDDYDTNLKMIINLSRTHFEETVDYKHKMIMNDEIEVFNRYNNVNTNEKISFYISILINIFLVCSMKYGSGNSLLLDSYSFYLMYFFMIIHSFWCVYIIEKFIYVKKHYSNIADQFKASGDIQSSNNNLDRAKVEWKIFSFYVKLLLTDNHIRIISYMFIISFLGILFKAYYLLPLQLFCSYRFSSILKNVLAAVKLKAQDFLSALVLVSFIILLYSSFSVYMYSTEVVIEENPVCRYFFDCFFYLFTYGMRSGSGLRFSPISITNNSFWKEFLAEWSFYFLLILIMSNIINAIIVDLFQKINEQETEKVKFLTKTCNICGLKDEDFKMRKMCYHHHVKEYHNPYFYVQYFYYLEKLKENDLTKTNSTVKKMLHEDTTLFIPRNQTKGLDCSNR